MGMKVLVAVLVMLFWYGNAFAEIKIHHKDEKSVSVTRSTWNEDIMWALAARHCAEHNKVQKEGITTFIEVILNQELGEPFRRDAMKKPVKVAGINKGDMKPQKPQ